MDNKDMPAMPSGKIDIDAPLGGDPFGNYTVKSLGLTKREHFAGLAMQGWLARCANAPSSVKLEPDVMAAVAVSMADALLAELDKAK
jgi:hypothetical protein